MTRAWAVLLIGSCCTTAWAQYPALSYSPPYAAYSSFYQPPIFPALSPYGYQPFGFAAVPFAGFNLLPPTPPSRYYVAPSGRDYLEQVRRNEKASYLQMKLIHELQR